MVTGWGVFPCSHEEPCTFAIGYDGVALPSYLLKKVIVEWTLPPFLQVALKTFVVASGRAGSTLSPNTDLGLFFGKGLFCAESPAKTAVSSGIRNNLPFFLKKTIFFIEVEQVTVTKRFN